MMRPLINGGRVLISESMKKTNNEKPNRPGLSRGRRALLIVAVLAFIGCIGAYIAYSYVLPAREIQALSRIADAKKTAEQSAAETSSEGPQPVYDVVLPKYETLLAQNGDLRGWLSVPEYGLDLPVVQGPDNDYYLRRSFTGEWSLAGTPFFDYRIADFVTLPRNTVVYGHNMRRNDIMFGVFQNLRTVEGYRSCPVIELDTLYRDYRWFVYAVFITNPYERQDNGYFFPYNFIGTTDTSFEGYLKEIDKRKFYSTGVELTAQDRLLTISTCCYDFKDARLVVVARLQREGEPDLPDTSLAAENPNPKFPQVWYSDRRMTNPFADDARWYPAADRDRD